MEEDEDAEIEHVFVAHEIDLDYEFDAARFFDFTRPETLAEAHQAELWFQNAPSYPPSPFVRKLVVREDLLLDNVSDSSKSENLECTIDVDDEKSSVPLGTGFSYTTLHTNGSKALGGDISSLLAGILQNDGARPLQIPTGLNFGNEILGDGLNSKAKSSLPKSSTLMQPTASQLAKQNRCAKYVGSRFQKLLKLLTQNERSLSISSGVESQAAKRQKLEGGLLCKVTDVKQQTNFVHKKSMRAVTIEQNSACSKLKLTIPREPDLKTAHRAQRIRPKNVGEAEHMTVDAPRFKARPLNRKILDAPSLLPPKRSTPRLPEFQEFHLKTLERAMQHTSATSSSLHCNDPDKGQDKNSAVSALDNRIKDSRRPTAMGAPTKGGLGVSHIFKARPLNKKTLRSKEDVVFQNSKRETAVPVEFDLQAEKGVQPNPPIELFGKLSLTSEGQANNGFNFRLPQHAGMCRKEKAFTFGENQNPRGNGSYISLMSARRSLGIR
ncbi:protein TPX2-like isoform X2 [Abrus precatorius]|uniref:Protein TPX2-like isoform X2 n=1 Tax=Abrus precatorius TaxID=3816 RepID=A0A8B8JSS6_ABRPR|nr:protein TPX2-like isoform X2 [Abrus precatorius]